MIKYSLICDKEHEFEGWFGSSDDYDKQLKHGFVDCPQCGSTKISKAIMAPRVSGTKKSRNEMQAQINTMATVAPQMPQEVITKIREIKKHIEKTSENVGDKFAEEARKIHYGEAEARGIYGKASVDEAISLVEEGVSVVPIPELPEDKN